MSINKRKKLVVLKFKIIVIIYINARIYINIYLLENYYIECEKVNNLLEKKICYIFIVKFFLINKKKF